jgi:FAD/FMN-containing dehydrogenase
LPFVPTELHGQPVVAIVCCYAGPVEDGEAVIKPMRSFGSSVFDLCQPKPYLEHQAMFDPSFKPGWWYYMRACDVTELNDDIIDITVEHASRIQSPLTSFPIWQFGGAVSRVDDDATVFGSRQAGHGFNVACATPTEDGFDEERQWARTFWDALAPYHTSVYVNFLMEEGDERIRQAYGDKKYDRLRALKRQWDPDNLFRLNQNIPPA